MRNYLFTKIFVLFFFLSLSINLNAQNVNIPDVNFKNYLLNNVSINTNGDEEISIEEAAAYTGGIFISNDTISDLTGIEAFNSITELDCKGNLLTNIDVSENSNLVSLDCSNNQLTSLDVSENSNLTDLVCSSNSLTSLDVSTNLSLTKLYCNYNSLQNLDVSKNTVLGKLNCGYNSLTNLNVSANKDLYYLGCSNNSLTSIDVSENTNLGSFDCSDNQLASIDISANTNIQVLTCHGNQLTSIDVSANTDLRSLDCYNNLLTSLDLSNNPELSYLYCQGNQLSNLDLSTNSKLSILYCWDNSLNSLNLSQNTNLTKLLCNGNALSNLDISSNINLTNIDCQGNLLTSLDVTANKDLVELNCYNNLLTSLDVSTVSSLSVLYCGSNSLTNLYLIDNTGLTQLDCRNNLISNLDLSTNTGLTQINCSSNSLNSLNVKNGNNYNFTYFNATDNANFTCIKVDDEEYMNSNWADGKDNLANYSETVCPFTIIASVLPENSGSIEGTGSYNSSDNVTLMATPTTGYTFTNWTEDGVEVSTNEVYSFTADTNRVLVANFTLNSYSITTNLNPENSGTVTGEGTYSHGDNVTLTATPETEYKFTNWTEDGIEVSTETSYSFTATEDRSLVANFTSTTGISNFDETDALVIYPNPNSGKFTFNLDNFYEDKLDVKIYSVSGVIVKELRMDKSIDKMSNIIDLGNISVGTYYITIISPKEKITKTIVVNK